MQEQPPLTSSDVIAKRQEDVQLFRDLLSVSEVIGGNEEDMQYQSLRCALRALDRDHPDAQHVHKLIRENGGADGAIQVQVRVR